MAQPPSAVRGRVTAFTLIELLTVVAIISLLISILMPSLSRARDQAKGIHCLARMKEFANAMAAYENIAQDLLPPAEWRPDPEKPDLRYGWAELVYGYIYKESVFDAQVRREDERCFPVQRNVGQQWWADYMVCKASPDRSDTGGHYRIYVPGWGSAKYPTDEDGRIDLDAYTPTPQTPGARDRVSPKLVILGDANEASYRGDGEKVGEIDDDTSSIDAGEANEAGPHGADGNRFSDRHYGGTNYLFQDFHAEWSTSLREKLAVDFNLDGINDIDVAP